MPESIEMPLMQRDATAEVINIRKSEKTGAARLSFSLSSELPVRQFWGTEILDHSPGAVRLKRLEGGAMPLLFNHNWDDPIGMVEAGRLADGRLHVDATLFDTARADEVRKMIDGGLRNVSTGYEIHELEQSADGAFHATDWEPLEASIVTVPADPGVGVGRSVNQKSKQVRVKRAENVAANPADVMEAIMPDTNPAAAAETAETKPAKVEITREAPMIDVADIEKRRKQSISKLARANSIPSDIEAHWIKTGASLDKVSDDMLTILEERSAASDVPSAIGMSKKEVRRYSILKAIRAAGSNDWSKAGLELEAHKTVMERHLVNPRGDRSVFVPFDVQVRDLSAALGTDTGSNLVGTDHMGGSFIEMLRNQSVTAQLGVTRLSGLQGNVSIPKQTSAGTAYWLADEDTGATESQQTISQVTLSPKNVAAITEVTHQLLQQSDPSVESLVMGDLSKVLALAADVAVIRGSGGTGQPQGVVGTSGLGAFTGTALDLAGVLDAQTDVFSANALSANCAYVTTGAVAALLKGRMKESGTWSPIWEGSLAMGSIEGHRAMASNQMAAASMLFGDFSQIILGEWGVLELAVDANANFAKGIQAIRAWYTMDVAVRHPGAFSYASTIT